MIPLGSGVTVKGGKFVTLLGYEVIEAPNNLNFSRSFLFSFAIPLTHVGAPVSYAPTEWLSLTAGPVVGWDVADDNNSGMSAMGQVALTPIKDLTTSVNWITGPEQFNTTDNFRTVIDLVVNYTGIKNAAVLSRKVAPAKPALERKRSRARRRWFSELTPGVEAV